MLDLKLIRDNPEFVKAGISKKQRDPALVDRVLEIDRRRREVVQEVERLRAEQNRASGEIAKLTGAAREQRIAGMREISSSLKIREPELRDVEATLQRALLELPNLPDESVPPGKGAAENVPVRHWGDKPRLDFKPLDHVETGTRLGILDMERGAKVSGSRFYYLRGAGVLLEQALIRLGMDLLLAQGFTPVITPILVRPEIITGAWGGADLGEQQAYRIAGEALALIGSSAQALAGAYKEELVRPQRRRPAGPAAGARPAPPERYRACAHSQRHRRGHKPGVACGVGAPPAERRYRPGAARPGAVYERDEGYTIVTLRIVVFG